MQKVLRKRKLVLNIVDWYLTSLSICYSLISQKFETHLPDSLAARALAAIQVLPVLVAPCMRCGRAFLYHCGAANQGPKDVCIGSSCRFLNY